MRILRVRRGFQADHSSSSYLFYAVDRPVSAKGQRLAHRYSSRAEVNEHSARYLKWGDSELSWDAYKTLLGEYYDVMASESYDWWTLILAVPKTPDMQALLAPFREARGYEDLGVEVEDYGHHFVVSVHCMFDYQGPVFDYEEDSLQTLVELLSEIRSEILRGDVSFLRAVASFYDAESGEEGRDSSEGPAPGAISAGRPDEHLTKAELQQQCAAGGVIFRKSWTKDRLRAALAAMEGERASAKSLAKAGAKVSLSRPSRTARRILDSLDRP